MNGPHLRTRANLHPRLQPLTRINAKFYFAASSPTDSSPAQVPCNIQAAMAKRFTASHCTFIVGPIHFTSTNAMPCAHQCLQSPHPEVTTSLSHHFPKSSQSHHPSRPPVLVVTTSQSHHFLKPPFPLVTTSQSHQLPFVTM